MILHLTTILHVLAAMAAPLVIDISFRRLLCSICAKFSLPPPRYGVSLDATGHFRAFVDIAVPRAGPMMEMVTCWGTPSTNIGRTREDAAKTAVERLRDELHFEIKNSNYEEWRFYENLYDQIAGEYDALQDQCKLLKVDYAVLKGKYNSLVGENARFTTERKDVKAAIGTCYAVVNSFNVVSVDKGLAPLNTEMPPVPSTEDAAAGAGVRARNTN